MSLIGAFKGYGATAREAQAAISSSQRDEEGARYVTVGQWGVHAHAKGFCTSMSISTLPKRWRFTDTSSREEADRLMYRRIV